MAKKGTSDILDLLQKKTAELALLCNGCARNSALNGKTRKMFEKFAMKLYSQLKALRIGDYSWALESVVKAILTEVNEAITACKDVTDDQTAALAIVETHEAIDALDSLIMPGTSVIGSSV